MPNKEDILHWTCSYCHQNNNTLKPKMVVQCSWCEKETSTLSILEED